VITPGVHNITHTDIFVECVTLRQLCIGSHIAKNRNWQRRSGTALESSVQSFVREERHWFGVCREERYHLARKERTDHTAGKERDVRENHCRKRSTSRKFRLSTVSCHLKTDYERAVIFTDFHIVLSNTCLCIHTRHTGSRISETGCLNWMLRFTVSRTQLAFTLKFCYRNSVPLLDRPHQYRA